jgi:hypothetical protein
MQLCGALQLPTDISAKGYASVNRVHKLSTVIMKVSTLPVTLVFHHQSKGLHIPRDN